MIFKKFKLKKKTKLKEKTNANLTLRTRIYRD